VAITPARGPDFIAAWGRATRDSVLHPADDAACQPARWRGHYANIAAFIPIERARAGNQP
jgi:hypothetical protein